MSEERELIEGEVTDEAAKKALAAPKLRATAQNERMKFRTTSVKLNKDKNGFYGFNFSVKPVDATGSVRTPGAFYNVVVPISNSAGEEPSGQRVGLTKQFAYATGAIKGVTRDAWWDKAEKVFRVADTGTTFTSKEEAEAYNISQYKALANDLKRRYNEGSTDDLLGLEFYAGVKHNGEYVNLTNLSAALPDDCTVVDDGFKAE